MVKIKDLRRHSAFWKGRKKQVKKYKVTNYYTNTNDKSKNVLMCICQG